MFGCVSRRPSGAWTAAILTTGRRGEKMTVLDAREGTQRCRPFHPRVSVDGRSDAVTRAWLLHRALRSIGGSGSQSTHECCICVGILSLPPSSRPQHQSILLCLEHLPHLLVDTRTLRTHSRRGGREQQTQLRQRADLFNVSAHGCALLLLITSRFFCVQRIGMECQRHGQRARMHAQRQRRGATA